MTVLIGSSAIGPYRTITAVADREELRAEVDSNPIWYHTLDLGDGVETPGWFDLRPIVDRFPWPDVEGKRCLDVATYDGFLAFELERRGAREVVATDIAHHASWDWLPRERRSGVAFLDSQAGTKGRGFEIAARALGSKVERVFVNVYDLTPAELGQFDVVVCGSLLLHLRDPFRALAAIHGVCSGAFLSLETVDLGLSALFRRRPVLHLEAVDGRWLIPSVAAHRRMLEVAGFDVERTSRPYAIPLGAGHPPPDRSVPGRARDLARRATAGGTGVPMSAVLSRPTEL
jgi:tRNA (mo5U34)-methyltransferase